MTKEIEDGGRVWALALARVLQPDDARSAYLRAELQKVEAERDALRNRLVEVLRELSEAYAALELLTSTPSSDAAS
jgi:hypothetical protein